MQNEKRYQTKNDKSKWLFQLLKFYVVEELFVSKSEDCVIFNCQRSPQNEFLGR